MAYLQRIIGLAGLPCLLLIFISACAPQPAPVPATTASVNAAVSGGYVLLSREEYAQRKQRTRGARVIRADGPKVIVHAPKAGGGLNSPLDFDVEFQPRAAAPDVASLKLEYDLGLFWKDVTGRLLRHAKVSGNRLVSRGAKLPSGEHRLRMSIRDVNGRETVHDFQFTVRD